MKMRFPIKCLSHYLVHSLLFLTSSQVVESFTTSSSSGLQHHHKILTSHGFVANDLVGISLSPTRLKRTILFSTVEEASTSKRKEEIQNITRNLLDEKYHAYWSEQITEDQMVSAKSAIKGWSQINSSTEATQEGAKKIELIIQRLENEKTTA